MSKRRAPKELMRKPKVETHGGECGWMGCKESASAHHDHSAVVKCKAPCIIGHPFGGWK